MKHQLRTPMIVACFAGLALSSVAFAQYGEVESAGEVVTTGSPIADVMAKVSPAVRTYNDHIVTLANPYMMGRLPGSEGMARSMDYMETHFRQYGLTPAFPDAQGNAFSSFRDPFPLGGEWKVQNESLIAMVNEEAMNFEADKDFVFTGLGSNGASAGRAVFVGYSIEEGPDGWSSYDEDVDLTGKVAVMLRFEPLNDEGTSLWTEDSGWTNQSAVDGKINAAVKRGATAVVIVNTPGAKDPRIGSLSRFSTSRRGVEVPVYFMSPEAGTRLLEGGDPDGRSIEELVELANEGFDTVELKAAMAFKGEAKREPVMAENVGAVLKGQGALADEYIVVGAHLDHLGMGYFGSRSGPGALHPGADDNASGSAALLLMAEKLAKTFEGDTNDRRSILIMAFSGEESGLNGSRHYVTDPIAPIEDHVLMVNWDMIGRISNERLLVAGAGSGEGLESFIQPHLDSSGLEIVIPPQMSGASDHTPFYQSKIPVLFSIIADFHEDYHTPNDVSWKINRVGAVKTVEMYHGIVQAAATHDGRFPYQQLGSGRRAAQAAPAAGDSPTMGDIKVRFGIMPGNYDETVEGVLIGGVSEAGPAAKAGVLAGDRLIRWDGQKITGVEHWMTLLAAHKPGDVINIGVEREGKEVTLSATLEGR